jgi:quercetin dioxygenase-like cupin family protein
MKSTALGFFLILCASGTALAQVNAPDLKWGPAPAVFPKGAEMAVLHGDPAKAGTFVIRLKMPAGYKIAPHWHPTDENITVLAGTFSMGMGETFDANATKPLTPGSYALMPAETHHFGWTKDGATIQLHGVGPFLIYYVNPADDPRRNATKP